MGLENIKQLFMQEWLTPQKSKERVALLLGSIDHAIECIDVDFLLFVRDINPASLTSEIATVDDRNVQIRRKKLPVAKSPFMLLNGAEPFDTHIPKQFPQQTLVCLEQHSFCHAKIHEGTAVDLIVVQRQRIL
jgi:hypothetical protein